ncbi:MAG: DNA repair protein RecO [Deltaproteobacteria bacterium]|nr:DNA repair protein RecO [Deltaproteobacteria bacterium]
MNSRTDEAIVLRVRDYGESDSIVSLFTKGEGRLSGIAKWAKKSRKRFGAALEIGACVHLVYDDHPHRDMVLLKEVNRLDLIQGWRSSWLSITAASFALELAAKLLPEKQQALQKYEVLEAFLKGLNEETLLPYLFDLQFRFLALSGWEPDFENCGICGHVLGGGEKASKRQGCFDHYWAHILGKELVSRRLLNELFLV